MIQYESKSGSEEVQGRLSERQEHPVEVQGRSGGGSGEIQEGSGEVQGSFRNFSERSLAEGALGAPHARSIINEE